MISYKTINGTTFFWGTPSNQDFDTHTPCHEMAEAPVSLLAKKQMRDFWKERKSSKNV